MHSTLSIPRLVTCILSLLLSILGLSLALISLANTAYSPVSSVLPSAYAACDSGSFYGASDCATIINPCSGNDCSALKAGGELERSLSGSIETTNSFTDYIQDIVVYLLGFSALICVILIIYQGARVMTSGGNEETLKKAKSAILYAFIGLTMIFLAYSLTIFIIGDKDGKNGILQRGAYMIRENLVSLSFVDTVDARIDPEVDEVISDTFDEYKIRFSQLMLAVYKEQNGAGVTPATINQLQALITESAKTLPDNQTTPNAIKIAKLNVALTQVLQNPKSKDAAAGLEGLISSFQSEAKIDRITGNITASPTSGNAPLLATFRAENVRDPSGKTIPNSNYIWWIKGPKNEKIVIGKGVSINYTFNEEKEYSVFLDVISNSRNSHAKTDVLPLRTSVAISALPKVANLFLYVNGVNVSQLDSIKVTPGQARGGLIIDATSSRPKEGTRFVSTRWDFGNGRSTFYDGRPRIERQIYAQEGDYSLNLVIRNNVNQEVTKKLMIQVRDPIASIVANKSSGYMTDDFRFSTTTANSRLILQHEWVITSNREARDIARVKGSTLSYKFKNVGDYTVKLISNTADGKTDTDSIVVTIAPRSPIVNFDLSKLSSEQPNVLRFNATQSIDPDTNSADKLQYRWKIDGVERELSDTQRNGAIGSYKLNELGQHTVELTVISPNGLSATLSKNISIDSLLGANLTIAQKIVRIGEPMLFVADAPEAKIFLWNFGDGNSTNPTTDRRITHIYQKSGIYTVTLTIRSGNTGASNSISRVIYVGDSDTPIPVIGIDQSGEKLTPDMQVCGAGRETYTISRLSSINISARESINIDGSNNNLTYSWKANGKTSSAQTLPFSFDELGCFPIRLSVRSNQNSAVASREVWVKVENISPTISGINVSSADTTKDPVIVTVDAINAKDPDGVITSYIWYYWTQTDSEPQELRVTRAPQSTFVLPRINDKYYFGVILEDSNGAKTKSIDVLSQDATITLTGDNINTPLIALKSSATTIAAGKTITFQASAKDLSDSSITEKTAFKWDFDGDGFYDKSSSGALATYTYQRPGAYRAKVKALYKGVSNTRSITINVVNDLKPSFDYIAIGRMIILVNSTQGVYTQATWELPDGGVSTEIDSVSMILPEGKDSAEVTLKVSDGESEVTTKATVKIDTRNIKTAANAQGVILLTQPRMVNNVITIDSPDERVSLYISAQGNVARYAIDDNLAIDTNLDGNASNDEDNKNSPTYRNGGVYTIKGFSDREATRTVRITFYDSTDKAIDTKEITIKSSFATVITQDADATPVSSDIREKDRKNLELLREIIQTQVAETSRPTFMSYYGKLKDEWFDQNQKTQTIIDFEKAIASASLDAKLVTEMHSILESFLATDDAMSGEVSIAINTIKGIIPTTSSYAQEVFGSDGNGGLLAEILSAPNNIEENKVKARRILELVKDDTNITNENKNILKSQLQVIIYSGTENIPEKEVAPTSEGEVASSGGFMGMVILIAKVIGILFGCLIGLILVVYLVFKLTNKNESIGFQDWMIEKLFQHGEQPSSSGTPVSQPVTPVIPKASAISTAPAPVVTPLDPLASTIPSAPVIAATTTVAASTATVAAATNELPSWLQQPIAAPIDPLPPVVQDDILSQVASAPEVFASPIPPAIVSGGDIPDWLKPSVSSPEVSSESLGAQDEGVSQSVSLSGEEIVSESIVPSLEPMLAPTFEPTPSASSELPSWLNATAADDSSQNSEIAKENNSLEENYSPEENNEEQAISQYVAPMEREPEISAPMPEPEVSVMPSWLQEASNQQASLEVSPPQESITSDTSFTEASIARSEESADEKSREEIDATASSVPRKPRRKSKLQSQEEAVALSGDAAPAPLPVANSDLPEWLRS